MRGVLKDEYEASKPSKEAFDAMEELGLVLKTIYLRMQKDGYRIKDGVMVNENDNE